MRQRKRLILRIACLVAIAFGALLVFQAAGIVPPLGVGWGDGARGRADSVEFDRAIILRTAAGMKTPPPGKYVYGVETLGQWDGAGIHYHRWNMAAGRTPVVAVIGTFAQVRLGLGWPLFVSLLAPALWLRHWVKERRLARSGRYCRQCGYDLRATPDRCPECGLVGDSVALRRQGTG